MDKVKIKSQDHMKERETFCSCRNSCQKGTGPKRVGCPCKDEGIYCSDQCECGTSVIVCKNKRAGVESDQLARQHKRDTDSDLVSDFKNLVIDQSDGDIFEEETPRIIRRPHSRNSTPTTSDVKKDKKISKIKKTSLRKQIHEIKNGFALVIHNKNYPLRPREGSEKDLEAIKLFCKEAGVELDVKENLKASEIEEYCEKLTAPEGHKFQNHDGFICFILGHGARSGICGIEDKVISVKTIVTYFKENKDLLGKPKLFFIQACRGTGSVEDDGDTAEQKESLCPPDSSDVLIAHSTIKGRLSYRDKRTGSWFIQTLMKQFKSHAQSEHVMDIMTLVNDDIAGSELEGYRQMPIQVSTLTKFVYFSMANDD